MIIWFYDCTILESKIHGMGRFATVGIPFGSKVLRIDGDITRNKHGSFVNHSIDNNLDLIGDNTWVTNRDIQAGEELTMNYLQWMREIPF